MTDEDDGLRRELLEARRRVRRQIEIQQSPARKRSRTPQQRVLVQRLRTLLAEIDEQLADLPPAPEPEREPD